MNAFSISTPITATPFLVNVDLSMQSYSWSYSGHFIGKYMWNAMSLAELLYAGYNIHSFDKTLTKINLESIFVLLFNNTFHNTNSAIAPLLSKSTQTLFWKVTVWASITHNLGGAWHHLPKTSKSTHPPFKSWLCLQTLQYHSPRHEDHIRIILGLCYWWILVLSDRLLHQVGHAVNHMRRLYLYIFLISPSLSSLYSTNQALAAVSHHCSQCCSCVSSCSLSSLPSLLSHSCLV